MKSRLHPIPVIVAILRAVKNKLARFSLKIMKDRENCNSQNYLTVIAHSET